MRLILFGTGEYYQRYKIWFEDELVLALVDNSTAKWGTRLDEKLIIRPDEIKEYNYDAIFVLTFAIREIKQQLVELGISKEKIFTFYDINTKIYSSEKRKEIFWYGTDKPQGDIVLLNSDLTLGGPALALYNIALILKKNGLDVTYASMVDGPLREMLIQKGISVVVDNNLLAETMLDNSWISNYKVAFCNTINYHVFLSKRQENIDVIWWLHDPVFFYEVANVEALKKIKTERLRVYTVGPVADAAIKMYRSDIKTNNLIYGVERNWDIPVRIDDGSDITRFISIGFVEPHKGHDVLIDAIKMLPADIRVKCTFKIVGKNTSLYAQRLMEEVENIPEVDFIGLLNRKEIHDILDDSDVLICPSRQDCMPTVCAEAMMHSVPCIVSDVVGTAAYLSPKNGFVFKNEQANELMGIICDVVKHPCKLRTMGNEAKEVYNSSFSMEALENNILKIMNIK